MMTCDDWRDAPSGDLVPLYAVERARWQRQLSWDVGPALQVVEQARTAGHLPGLLVRERDGTPVGWCFYVLAQGGLQIGALSGATAASLRLMLDRIFRSAESQLAQELSCFLFPVSTSVRAALARQRFALYAHDYLTAAIPAGPSDGRGDGPGPPSGVRPWSPADSAAAVRLMARAYAGDHTARCFSRHGRLEEWAHYVGQLLAGPGCGAFRPEASFVVPSIDTPSGLAAVALTTFVAPGTAHLAQLVVDPVLRRRGMGRALLQLVTRQVREAGANRLTLIVGEGNNSARTLYAGAGFSRAATFLYGHRGAAPRVFDVPLAAAAGARAAAAHASQADANASQNL
jgi:ribosomal protein S18 acetylase RimI-like enzyme